MGRASRIAYAIGSLAVAGLWVLLWIAAYWAMWPITPAFDFSEEPAQPERVLSRGEPLTFDRIIIVRQEIPAVVTRWIEPEPPTDEQWGRIESIRTYTAKRHIVHREQPLPNLAPGRYLYRSTVAYRVNPLRTVVQQAPDVPFRVVP
jgi:hypothetical protein